MLRRLIPVAALLAVLLVPTGALAHPLIDQARAAYDSTRHRQALELLERAEDGADLSREDLVQLLLIRALAHRALRQMELAEVDMFRLASLDPERQLGREVPPALRRLFDQGRERVPGPIRIVVRATREGEVVTVQAEVTDDVAALAQGFRLFGRPAGGVVRQTGEARLSVNVMPNEAAEYWAEVLGPGGAVIANHASETSPARLDGSGASGGGGSGSGGLEPGDLGGSGGSEGSEGSEGSGGGDEGVPAWPFIVGGLVLAAGIAVILAVVLTQPSDETQLTRPGVANLVSAPLVLLTFE